VEGLQQAVPVIDLAPEALIEHGLTVMGPAVPIGVSGATPVQATAGAPPA
jgi:hypothetical protein